jgi:hypothetical protein
MTDFAVTGKKRSGKGLFCAGLIRDCLVSGRRVATNMDIFPESMLGPLNKATFYRLPDCPSIADLEAIGKGNDIVDDDRNGIIILDEASKYFNARTYADKDRQAMLDWLIHSGKLGWDVYYQMQGLVQVDKQLRETQIEFHVPVKCTKSWPIPFVTSLASIIGLTIRFPKMHIGIYKQGVERDSMVVDRKWYRAKDLYNAYDTRQVFLDRTHPDACGLHTVLSPWHTVGRHLAWVPAKPLRFLFGVIGYDWTKSARNQQKPRHLKPKHPLAVTLSKLPPDVALMHWRRLDRLGAFE